MSRFFPEKERDVKDDVKEYLEEIGAWWYMPVNRNRKGVPDFIVCYQGFFLAIETKRKRNSRVPELQRLELERIRKNRGVALLCSDVKQLHGYIDCLNGLAFMLSGSTADVARSDEKSAGLRAQG